MLVVEPAASVTAGSLVPDEATLKLVDDELPSVVTVFPVVVVGRDEVVVVGRVVVVGWPVVVVAGRVVVVAGIVVVVVGCVVVVVG